MSTLAAAIRTAQIADDAFEAAIKGAGIKSRWHSFGNPPPAIVAEAQAVKFAADNAMHAAFVASREGR